MKKLMASAILMFIALLLSTASCAGELEDPIDCFNLCSRYNDCVTEIDVNACTDTCEDQTNSDDVLEAQGELCSDCLDETSCSEAGRCFSNCPVNPGLDDGLPFFGSARSPLPSHDHSRLR